MRQRMALLAASALAVTLLGVAAPTASAATASPQDKHQASFACSSPKGAKATFSWFDGFVNSNVYWYNHCSHSVTAGVVSEDVDGRLQVIDCLNLKAGARDHKSEHTGVNTKIVRIKNGCKL